MSIITVSVMLRYFPVVPVWIETTLDLHHLAHQGKTTPTMCSKKFKNRQYLKTEFSLSFQRYIILPKWKWQETWPLSDFS